MFRPNRIGPWPIGDIETPAWSPSTTLLGNIDDVAQPLLGCGVRSVTVPEITNYEHFLCENKTITTSQATGMGLGCLISGANEDPTSNTIFAVSGYCKWTAITANYAQNLFPFIAKLDATPSDPEALALLDRS